MKTENIYATSTVERLTCVPRVQELCSSNHGLAKSYRALQKHYRFNIM